MFGRLLWRLLRGSGGRLAVALIAVISGAAVISALLNLQFDIERKLTQEFRALGPNLLITSRSGATAAPSDFPGQAAAPQVINQGVVARAIDATRTANLAGALPYLYVVARAADTPVVVAGTDLAEAARMNPSWKLSEASSSANAPTARKCIVGRRAAEKLGLAAGGTVELRYQERSEQFAIASVLDSGAAEDDQILVDLQDAQALAGMPGQIEAEELRVAGDSANVTAYASRLAAALPEESVQPLRQVTDAEGNLLRRTRLLIGSTVALILLLTALCVLATMAALAMERRADVGLMKALGGSIARILALFLAEVSVVGAAGGAIGCLAGYALARWMGERVFGAAVSPRWEIFPLTVVLMALVALAGALPLQRLGRVKPAVILRSE
jgi:putative ABC transport system permease protein